MFTLEIFVGIILCLLPFPVHCIVDSSKFISWVLSEISSEILRPQPYKISIIIFISQAEVKKFYFFVNFQFFESRKSLQNTRAFRAV